MWIVKLALTRPYTFIVLAILILIAAPVVITRTPTDIFPNINIPVVSVAWQYTGLEPEELEGRLTTPFEKTLTTLVDNIEHIESTTYRGQAVIKIYLQQGASLDTANSQVSAASEFELRSLPPSTLPPQIINFSASSVPILQLGLSGEGLNEQDLNDYGLNFIRPQLVTVPGAVVPNVYGGKQRTIMINIDPKKLQATGLSPSDVLTAFGTQNVVQPGGTTKIGLYEYDVLVNSSPSTIAGLSNIPIRKVGNTIIYLRDIATVADGSIPQTNIVRQDGARGVLITILKSGSASTLSVVEGIRSLLPRIKLTLPPALKITPLADQAIFVRASVQGVIREAIIAAALTGLMILLFLGSWRATLIIAVSIPLSILSSIIVLGLIGETINIMTLGGLALAVGILVDDATVTIENIERYLEEGAELNEGILEGAAQIAVPALVSTLCICIVFLPMFFLSGVSRYLFVPLAEAVVFAMLASYALSRTLVPTLAMYLLKKHDHHAVKSQNPFLAKLPARLRAPVSKRSAAAYASMLGSLIRDPQALRADLPARSASPSSCSSPSSARTSFPRLRQRLVPPPPARARRNPHRRDRQALRPGRSPYPQDHSARRDGQHPRQHRPALLHPQHAARLPPGSSARATPTSLSRSTKSTTRRQATSPNSASKLPNAFPGSIFYFLPSDIVTQILNFGLPAPIDIQFDGANIGGNRKVANDVMIELHKIPGLVDLRIQQPDDYPALKIDVDRTKAQQGGYNFQNVGGSLVNILSGSTQLNPQFYLNPKNGVTYQHPVAQAPQYTVQSMSDLEEHPHQLAQRHQAPRSSPTSPPSPAPPRCQSSIPLQHPPHARYLRQRRRTRSRLRQPRHQQGRRSPPQRTSPR